MRATRTWTQLDLGIAEWFHEGDWDYGPSLLDVIHGLGRKYQCTQTAARAHWRGVRDFFERSVDAVWLLDQQAGVFVDCNLAAVELIGAENKHQLLRTRQSPNQGIACWCEPWLSALLFLKDQKRTLMKRTGVLLAATCAHFIAFAGQATEPKPGEEPPPFGLESILQAPNGAMPSWKALKGRVVVLEFWATWCGPCIAAIPHLNELADKFKGQPIQFIAITDQDETVVRPFLRRKPIHAWIGLDTDKSMLDDYGVMAIPHTVVVDQKGIIAGITHPTFLTEGHLKDLLAGKKIAIGQRTSEGGARPGPAAARSKPEREALFQVIIRPSERGPTISTSNKGSLTVSGATVLDILSSSYSINPSRIVVSSTLPEGRFDFVIKTPGTENETVKAWLRQAVESTFGITVRLETREMDTFVLTASQPTEHLAPTVSTGGSSMSSGGGSLNCVNQSMSSLAGSLERILHKPVINETSLTNQYDFQLLWEEKESGETDSAELIRALYEQLGLKLVPAKRAVELLAVTAANRQAGLSESRVTK